MRSYLKLSGLLIMGTLFCSVAISGTDAPVKNIAPDPLTEFKAQIKKAKGDSPKAEAAVDQLTTKFEDKTYSFKDPNVMNIVFGAFDCGSSEKLYVEMANQLLKEFTSDPASVLNSALALQCSEVTQGKNWLARVFSCVLKDKATPYDHIDGALELGWSASPPRKSDDKAAPREALLKKVNGILNTQLEQIAKDEAQAYHCDLVDKKKREKVRNAVIDFQKALNKYIPVSRVSGRNTSTADSKDSH